MTPPVQDLTVGDQDVTLNADFGELGAADSYLLAVLDTNDNVYVTSRANVSASLSLADYQAAFQNPDDGNVYVFTGIGTGNTGSATHSATTGNVTVTLKSVPATFSSVSNVYVYSLGSGGTITIDPSVTAPVSVYGPESSVTGEVANWPDVALEADVPTAAESGGQPGEFTFYCPNDDATGNLTRYFLVSRRPLVGRPLHDRRGLCRLRAGGSGIVRGDFRRQPVGHRPDHAERHPRDQRERGGDVDPGRRERLRLVTMWIATKPRHRDHFQ